MRIALFVTCVADTMFPEAARATAEVLERLGHEVVVPPEQTCCGQMHLNSGYRRDAAGLARRFVETFGDYDLVVAPSSSCVGAVRELYPKLLGLAHPVLERTVELSELLVHRLGVEDVGASFPHRVAYHPTCHSLRVTRVGDAPLRLLRRVRGLELVELAKARRSAAASAVRSRSRTRTPRARCWPTSATRWRTAAPRSARPSTAPACSRSAAASRVSDLECACCTWPSPGVAVRASAESFPDAARRELANTQLRENLRSATETIRSKRAQTVAELPDWEQLREAGAAIKADVLAHLGDYLVQFEAAVQRAGGQVHWARDAAEANAIVAEVARSHGASEVVKVKSLTTDEIELNSALEPAGIHALETDFAELILQLDGDWSSHILVPAIHRNRREIRDLFTRTIAPDIGSDDPRELAEASRVYLRERFLEAKVGVSGANFGIAETGTLCVVESEGNGRMCTTLPPVLVSDPGDREAATHVRRSRGVPPAPAALVDRRADEPLHVVVDRCQRRRWPAGAPRRAAG